MSTEAVDLCRVLLEELFGETVAAVAAVLLSGPAAFPVIIGHFKHNSKIRVLEVRKALVILEQHELVRFTADSNGRVIYRCYVNDIVRLVRWPRCALTAKTLYGEIAEAIVEELISQGRLACSDCLKRVSTRLEFSFDEVKTKFARLAESQFVIRCPQVKPAEGGDDSEAPRCPTFQPFNNPFTMPDNILPVSASSNGTGGRKRKIEETEESTAADAGILWRVNWQRFDQYFRDEIVLELIHSIGNEKCVEVTRALLKISELKSDTGTASFPISVHDVVRVAASNDMNLPKSVIESCLEFISEDQTRIIRRAGDSGGGMYVIDFEKALQAMCRATIESVVRETYDTKGVRVFNLLLAKGFLEQEQIEKFAMLSSKEGKELTYQLMKDGFISVREFAKSNDFAPARTFYLFHVEMHRIAQNLQLRSCKILKNLILRRQHDNKEHKNLTDRQLKMETIVANIESDANLEEEAKKQQIAEVEETYLTAADRQELDRFRQGVTSLLYAEADVDRSIFILDCYLHFARRRI